MKKLLALLLTTVFTLSIAACGSLGADSTETTAAVQEGVFQVGFGRVNITPEESVPLGGANNTERRLSQNILDEIYMTCIAIQDVEGDVVILCHVDLGNARAATLDSVRKSMAALTGVPVEHITMTATHTHASVDPTRTDFDSVLRYNADILGEAAPQAAVLAMEDLAPATVSVGSVETESLNFIRHYIQEDDSIAGDGFGDWLSSDPVKHTAEADPTMYAVRFHRENKKDVVLFNWRAHPAMVGTTGYQLSSDFIGPFRNRLEESEDILTAYYQGAAGNVNPSSRIQIERRALDNEEHGYFLAEHALDCLANNMKPIEVQDIYHEYIEWEGKVNHSKDHMLIEAKAVYSIQQSVKEYSQMKAIAEQYGLRSGYEAGAIVQRAAMDEAQTIRLGVMTLGEDLAIAFHSGEMFSEISEQLEQMSPYETTLWFSYTNDHQSYFPSEFGWSYSSYESDISLFEPGTAEQIRDFLAEKLIKLKTQTES